MIKAFSAQLSHVLQDGKRGSVIRITNFESRKND